MSKGSRQRPIDPNLERKVFEDNWDRIFNGKKIKEKRLRESERQQYIESYTPIEWKATHFQEGSLQYAEYSIQYHAPTTDH